MPGLAAALHSARMLPPPRYDEASWSFIAALLDVLRLVLARLQLVFARENAIDYPESTMIALRALSSDEGPSDLLLALDMKMEHLLLDEFQDTSLAQHELIERLTEGWTPGDGRTLFIVGDPMQSIFGFREADVGLFLTAQKNRRIGSVALEPLTLARNFRSQTGPRRLGERQSFPGVFSSSTDPAHGQHRVQSLDRDARRRPKPAVTVDLCVDARQEAATDRVARSRSRSRALLKRSRCWFASVRTWPSYCRRCGRTKSHSARSSSITSRNARSSSIFAR